MEGSTAQLAALQQQHEQLSAQMEECERLAALNSELRLISHNMEELREEQMQLKPQAELAQELRRHNQQLEQEAAHLPSIKVRCRTVRCFECPNLPTCGVPVQPAHRSCCTHVSP